MEKSGALGIALSGIGIVLLLFTFYMAYRLFSTTVAAGGMQETIALLLFSAVKALFLGIMAWVGSIFLVRGVEYLKVEKGVGMVTFKVEKGVGVAKIDEKALEKQ